MRFTSRRAPRRAPKSAAHRHLPLAGAALFASLALLPATAGATSWTNPAGGSCNVSGNWSAGTPTSAVTADFTLNNTYNVTATASISAQSANISQGNVTFSFGANTLNASSSLTVSTGAALTLASGTINTTSMSVATGGTFTQTSGTLGSTIILQSAGTLNLGGPQTFYNVTSTLGIAAGTTTLTADATKVLAASTLVIAPAAKLDLTKGDLILHSTPATLTSDYATLESDITGGKIISSLSSAATGLGLVKGSDYLQLHGAGALFAGQSVANTDLLVRYTYLGDANFDGKITAADYAQIDVGFLLDNFDGTDNPAQWINGDFNGDGVINYKDYALIDYAYAHQSGQLAGTSASAMIANHAAQFGAPYLAALNALNAQPVPEPAGLSLLALGALALSRRPRPFARPR